jgi:hypothetical protein
MRLSQLISIDTNKNRKSHFIFWFSLSLTFAAIYACLALQQAFSGEWVIQDDVRQHVFWMAKFQDPELFKHDLIANYFQSVAPVGYTSLYRLAAYIGVNPILFSKILPPIVGILTSIYCFVFCLEILPVPIAGFISTLVLNQNFWMKDEIVSATPRAFVALLFLAFLYYLSKRSLIPGLLAIALIGMFYPQYLFLCAGMLVFPLLNQKNRQDYRFCLLGIGMAAGIMLLYALNSSEFAPTISAAEARKLPEFLPGGRAVFFRDDWWDFWLGGGRSGMFSRGLFTPITLLTGLFLPLLLRFPKQFPLAVAIAPNLVLLPQLLLVSVVMFFLAHAVLFKLHLPSRYTGYSFRIAIAIATAIAITIILDALVKNLSLPSTSLGKGILPIQKFLSVTAIALITIAIVFYPSFVNNFPATKYKIGNAPKLYKFLQAQPKDTLIASITDEIDYVPTFALRSILVGQEYAIPYHLGYYKIFRQRLLDLVYAQYSSDAEEVKKFIDRYKIDFWLIDKKAFSSKYLANNSSVKQYQDIVKEISDDLQVNKVPVIKNLLDRCKVFEEDNLVVLSAKCIARFE